MIESILADLYKFLGVKAIKGKNDRAGYYLIKISDTEEVWVKELNPGIFMQSIIGSNIGNIGKEDFYTYVMTANFLGQGTGGSVIGLTPEENYLTLSLPINYEINYKIFRDKLEEFLNYLSYWKKEIREYETRQV